MNICILGDSISKGVTFDGLSSKYNQLKNSYVAILQEKFGLSINNLSKFGCTVTKGLAMLDFHKQAVAESQYAIVEYGGNDSDMRWDEVAKAPDCTHLPLTEKSDFRCKYEDMIRQIQNLGTAPILLNLPPIDAQRYFERISQGKNGENILKYLGGDVHYIYRWHESYNLEISRIAMEMHVTMIDVRSAFLLDKNSRALICSDGIHPSEQGHRLIADSIEDYIDKAS